MQQNSKYRICSDWDETINQITSENGKLVQEEVQDKTGPSRKWDPQEISWLSNVWPQWQLVFA